MEPPGDAPAHLGRYELIARLATGGMGEIFLARLEGAAGFEKLFVIKRILPHLAGDLRFRAMLIGEARIASMMAHANICQVYELGETDGQLYIVMEYLEGTTMLPLLRKVSKGGSGLDLGFIAGVIQQVTDGLHYAHELKERSGEYLGIVHRDVSPSNIFLTDAGVVKVLDFGIAKVKNASAQTQTGTVKGKYAYMAPEQLRGIAVDRRADVFALGVVVYEMLALRRLFQRKTDYLTFRAVMEQPITDIRHYRADCPDALARAVSLALDRDPSNRFDTARQFGTAVLDAISTARRPWSQGEVSDFVTMQFTEEIRQRGLQITAAVHASGRKSMPLIAQPDDDATELEDSAPDFPPVDSGVSETPVDIRHLRGPSDEHTAVADPPVNPPSLSALRGVPATGSPQQPSTGTQPQPILVVNSRRSVIWPLVAFAMVAVSGGALFLVWDQRRNPQHSTFVIESGRATGSGSSIVIVPDRPARPEPVEPDPSTSNEADSAEPALPGSGGDGARADGAGPDVAGAHRADPPVDRAEPASSDVARTGKASARKSPQTEAVMHVTDEQKLHDTVKNHVKRHHTSAVNRCISEHKEDAHGVVLELKVRPDGRLRDITLTPDRVNSSPLGACIKNVFKAAVFPHGNTNYTFTVALTGPA